MTKARELITCPLCGSSVRKERLERHKQETCPNRFNKSSSSSTVRRPTSSIDPKTVACPKCSQKAKVLWHNNVNRTLLPICPICYRQLSKHNNDIINYQALFLPIFSKNVQGLWILTSFLNYSFVELASYIDRCITDIQYKTSNNRLYIQDKTALLQLTEHLSTMEYSDVINLMTFEEFKEKHYLSALQNLLNFKRAYEHLLKQCEAAYDKYVNSTDKKANTIRWRRANFVRNLRNQIIQIQENVNIDLQEDIFSSATVSWYMLPPGEHPFAEIMAYFNGIHNATSNIYYEPQRLHKVYELKPSKIYGGKGSFTGYIAFHFEDLNIAVLECPLSGNAIYILKGDWEPLSRLTKAELLWYHEDEVIRIVHSGDWFSRLKCTLFPKQRQLDTAILPQS